MQGGVVGFGVFLALVGILIGVLTSKGGSVEMGGGSITAIGVPLGLVVIGLFAIITGIYLS